MFISSKIFFTSHLREVYKRGRPSIKYSSTFMTGFWTFWTNKFSPYYEILNKCLLEIIESGLIYRIVRPYEERPDTDPIGPQVLTMEPLEWGFIICGVFLAISAAIFGAERLVYGIKRGPKNQNVVAHGKPKEKFLILQEYRKYIEKN